MHLFSWRNAMIAVLVVLIATVLIVFAGNIESFRAQAEAEQLESARNLVERAVVQCYALEGSYPPNLEYLRNYGVLPNYDKFTYIYEVVGANVFPIIEVKGKE